MTSGNSDSLAARTNTEHRMESLGYKVLTDQQSSLGIINIAEEGAARLARTKAAKTTRARVICCSLDALALTKH